MATDSTNVIVLSAQALFILSLISCAFCAKLPASPAEQQGLKNTNGVNSDGNPSGTVPISSAGVRNSVPIVASTDDFEVVAHTGAEGLGRQKRYIGWGRRPSLRYSKATSVFDHDSLFNRLHNNFDKRGFGPEAPISSFRELRMKQKVPNIQLLLPHMQMRNARAPSSDTDADDVPPGLMINDLERPSGKLTPEDLDALAYLLEGDIQ